MKINLSVEDVLALLEEGHEIHFKPEPKKTKMRDKDASDWKVYRTTQYKEKDDE